MKIVAILLIVLNILVYAVLVFGAEDNFSGITKDCPLGSAVLVNNKSKISLDVDCIEYDYNTDTWETWTMEGKVKAKCYLNRKEWRAYTINGELYVNNDGKLVIREPSSRN